MGTRARAHGPGGGDLQPVEREAHTLEFVFEHLGEARAGAAATRSRSPPARRIGRVDVNKETCTLCMACVGACPESALVDGRDTPMLKFIERNCVQCGLCVKPAPSRRPALAPRLLLTAEAKQEVVLNQAEPFNCVRCGKPFGTKQMIDSMLARLTGHSMFAAGGALRRLSMCADCRVIDMMENKDEVSIHDVHRVSISDAEIPSVTPEDQARADLRAARSALVCGAGCALLSAIAQAGDIVGEGEQIGLASAWRELRGGRCWKPLLRRPAMSTRMCSSDG